jgi:hypothetical protein
MYHGVFWLHHDGSAGARSVERRRVIAHEPIGAQIA